MGDDLEVMYGIPYSVVGEVNYVPVPVPRLGAVWWLERSLPAKYG